MKLLSRQGRHRANVLGAGGGELYAIIGPEAMQALGALVVEYGNKTAAVTAALVAHAKTIAGMPQGILVVTTPNEDSTP